MKETGSAGRQQDEQREMSYREAEEWIAATTGGHGTAKYSNTDAKEVQRKNEESEMK